MVNTYTTEYYSLIKNECDLTICDNVDKLDEG